MNNKTALRQQPKEMRSAVIRIIKYLEGCQKAAAFGDNGKCARNAGFRRAGNIETP